jgi:hypothetical protein
LKKLMKGYCRIVGYVVNCNMECEHCHQGRNPIPLKQRVAARAKEQQREAAPELRIMENSAVITDVPSVRETSRQSNRLQRSGEGIGLLQLVLILALVFCAATYAAYKYEPFGQTPAGVWLIEQSQSILAIFANPTVPVAATEAAPMIAGCKPKSEADASRVDSFVVKFTGNVPSFEGLKLGTKEYLLVCFPVGPMTEFVSDSAKANAMATLIDSKRTAEIMAIVTGPTLAKGYWLIPVVASNATQPPVISNSQPQAAAVQMQATATMQATRTQVPTLAPVVIDVVIPTVAKPTARPTAVLHIYPTARPTAILHIYPTKPAVTALATTMSKVLTLAAPQATQAPTKAPTYAKTTMSRLLTLAAPTKAAR